MLTQRPQVWDQQRGTTWREAGWRPGWDLPLPAPCSAGRPALPRNHDLCQGRRPTQVMGQTFSPQTFSVPHFLRAQVEAWPLPQGVPVPMRACTLCHVMKTTIQQWEWIACVPGVRLPALTPSNLTAVLQSRQCSPCWHLSLLGGALVGAQTPAPLSTS